MININVELIKSPKYEKHYKYQLKVSINLDNNEEIICYEVLSKNNYICIANIINNAYLGKLFIGNIEMDKYKIIIDINTKISKYDTIIFTDEGNKNISLDNILTRSLLSQLYKTISSLNINDIYL